MENKELIGSVRKNSKEFITVHVQEYRGVICVDARVCVQGTDFANPVIATKKGLCLRPEIVKKLLPVLAKAQAMAEALEPEGLYSDKSNAPFEGEIHDEETGNVLR